MLKNLKQVTQIEKRAKLIYNPHAGLKRRMFTATATLEDVTSLMNQYQIPVDYFPTKGPGHATKLAQESIHEGYHMVLVAGGDGTVGEAANGLIGTDMTLGILPLGSYMNIARMLSIPTELEKAVQLIKIGRTRKIDVGCVARLNGEKLSDPYYFLENAGIGLEAELHEDFLEFERGNKKALFKMITTIINYYAHKATVIIDGQEMKTRAPIITVSNGPFTGAAIPVAPQAKLNDHKLTVSFFNMTKFQALRYFISTVWRQKNSSREIITYQAKKVTIKTHAQRLVHADARVFGTTPVTFTIIPNALSVICGFPKNAQESSLGKRTYLDL